jgi:hypothetical protein
MLDVVKYRGSIFHFNIIPELRWQWDLNWLAETARESSMKFFSLGTNEMLKVKKNMSMRSHTSFL